MSRLLIARILVALFLLTPLASLVSAAEPLRIATFHVDATPPLGSPCATRSSNRPRPLPIHCRPGASLFSPTRRRSCSARVDWIGIGNSGYDAWREALARSAGTTADRVAVHCLHQHDARM